MQNYDIGHLVFVFIIYFSPTIIASFRKHLSEFAIFWTNLFFGWTIIGWLICLIWAFSGNTWKNREREIELMVKKRYEKNQRQIASKQ